MISEIQQRILSALLKTLHPIARLMLRCGIGYREFAEISKTAFVDVATSDYGIRGRPTNISRVAVMTGLTRKEVKRLRDKTAAGEASRVYRYNPGADILHHWHVDPDFIDEAGRPLVLDFEGPEKSFARLVKKYGGDIPPGAMRTELKRVGAVEVMPSGQLKAIKRNFSAPTRGERTVEALSNGLYTFAQNAVHNSDPENTDNAWIQRIVYTHHMRPDDLGRIRRVTRDRLIEFSESLDDLLSAYESFYKGDEVAEDEGEERLTVGIGLYYFEENGAEASSSSSKPGRRRKERKIK